MTRMQRLYWGGKGVAAQWRAICDRGAFSDGDGETESIVAEIVSAIRREGDVALCRYTEQFDQRSPRETEFGRSYEIPQDQWHEAWLRCTPQVQDALTLAAERIAHFHEPQKISGYQIAGEGLALRVSALARVGLYVPGGTALYPSSVLMTAIPAQVAGVKEIIMVTPGASDETLAAAKLAGVSRVFEIGGAQAIAALAFGTETVPRVDKIVGPGNRWVATAKRQVFGQVDIDSIAGPSEILIIADDSASPRLVASDLLAQAEHDECARSILVSDSESFLDQVDAEVSSQLASLPRQRIARASIETYGTSVLVHTIAEAVHLANEYAPEHLELALRDAEAQVESIQTAGAIFVGHFSPEAAGDYSAGPNHVLPTGGAARYASPLGVYDFIKYTSVLSLSKPQLHSLRTSIATLTDVEGLAGHGRSVSLRFESDDND